MIISIKPKKGVIETSFANAGKFSGHTDLTYTDIPPQYMTLLAIKQDSLKQGKTILCDSIKALKYLDKKDLEELRKNQYTYNAPSHYKSEKDKQVGKAIISFDYYRLLLRCRKDKLSCVEPVGLSAFNNFVHVLETRASEEFLLEENSLVCIDNWRLTHARKAFIPTYKENDRQLLRTYGCADTSIYGDNFCNTTLTVLN